MKGSRPMAANGFDDDRTRTFTNLAAGTTVSHYTIISKIGAGGMGEVYLAEDSQLDRKVALKFLPPHLSQDEASRARFTREAKAAAKLDHPNIVPVYEVDEFRGRPFFAMARVEGQSLREVIKQGKLTVADAVDLTMQICEGLHKAHESGVVHRDIKPGNIIIDREGRARILDFGLATVSGKEKLTKTGSTLGTVGYMSPEQIEGKHVDHRSDLFSVGVILYEMLTGHRPFEGDTDAAVARSITDKTPEPVARYKSGTTGELQQIIDKALAKDPSLRYQHADGMLADLKRLELGIPIARKKRSRVLIFVSAIIVLAAFSGYYYLSKPDSRVPVKQVRKRQVTFDGDVHSSSLSPDGKYLAYVRGTHGGISKPETADSMYLFVLDLDAGEPIKVFTDWWIAGVWWTPDGRELLVRGDNDEQGGFYILPRLGGTPRYYSIDGVGTYWRTTWSPDGNRFAATSDYWPGTVFVIDRNTSQTTPVKVEGDFNWIYDLVWASSFDKLLLVIHGDDGFRICSVPVMGGELTEIRRGWIGSPSWASDGKSIRYLRQRGRLADLMSIEVDVKTLRWTGEPTLLVADVAMTDRVGLDTSASRLCYVQRANWSNIGVVDLNSSGRVASEPRQLTTGTTTHHTPSVSPDGNSVACIKSIDGVQQVVILDIESGNLRRISYTGDYNFGCAWSPDGSQLAYATVHNGTARLAIIGAKGGVPVVYDSCVVSQTNIGQMYSIGWQPGTRILYETPGLRTLEGFDPKTETWNPIGPADDSIGMRLYPIGSPDSNLFAFYWNRRPRNTDYVDEPLSETGVWISSFTGERARFVGPNSVPIGWSPDGEWVYAWRFDNRYLVRISSITGAVDSLGTVIGASPTGVSISPDATKLVYVIWESSADLWLVENIPQQ